MEVRHHLQSLKRMSRFEKSNYYKLKEIGNFTDQSSLVMQTGLLHVQW